MQKDKKRKQKKYLKKKLYPREKNQSLISYYYGVNMYRCE